MNKNLLTVFSLVLISNAIVASEPTQNAQPAAASAALTVNPLGQPAAAAASNSKQQSEQEPVINERVPIPHYTIRFESTTNHRKEAYEFGHKVQKSKTILMWVAEAGSLDTLKKLLEEGTDVTKKDYCGRTAYDYSQSYHELGLTDAEIQAKRDAMRELFLKYSTAQTYRGILPSPEEFGKLKALLFGSANL